MKLDIFRTRVFAASPTGGNPCPVVLNAEILSGADMQMLARRFGLDVIRVGQGYAIGAPCLIEAIADCSTRKIVATAIRGSARIVNHEQIVVEQTSICGGSFNP